MAVVENLGLLLGSAVPSFMDTLKFIRQSQENAEQLRIQRARLAADQRVAELRQRIEDLQAVDDVRQAVFTEGDTRWNTAYVDAITNVGKEQADALFFRGDDPVVMTESDLDSVMDLTKRVGTSGGSGGAGLTARQKEILDYYKGQLDFEEQGINSLRTERSNLVAQRDQFNTGATQYGRMQQQIDNLDSEIQRREQGLSVARRDLQNAIENPDLSFGGIEDRTKEQIELLQRSTTPTQIQGGSSFGPPSVFGFPQPPTYPAGSPLNSATINPRIEVNQGVTPTAQDTTGARQMLEQLREQDQEALRILGDTSRRTY